MACLMVALLAQLLLPAMHALVHHAEGREQAGHRHAHGLKPARHHGARQLTWVIERAGGQAKPKARAVAARSHSHREGAAHTHDPQEPSPPAPSPGHHHHDGDRPGGPHGASSLEHFTAFFLEATPPKLALPFRRTSPAPVLLVEGRRPPALVVRAQPVRGPPQLS